MIDKAKKHRSHVSSKEAKARGWRKVPRKGTGRKTMEGERSIGDGKAKD